MGEDRFDDVLTALARARTRREMLAALGVGAAGSAAATASGEAQNLECRGVSGRCKRNAQCCSGRCRTRRGKKQGRCRCSTLGKRCLVTRDCCDGEDELVCDGGFCEPAVQD